MNFRGTTVVTLFTAVNLLLTMANQVVLAYLFGAGASMDAFLVCSAFPLVVLNLAIGDLGYVLIPLLIQYEIAHEIRRAVDSTFSAVLAVSILITLLGVLEHRTILRFTTASSLPAFTFELAVSLAPVVWAIIGLTVISSYLTGLHHYYRLFSAAAATMALPYLGMILGGLSGAHSAGIHAVCWGWAAGTLARTAILYLTLPGPWPGLCFPSLHPATTALLRSLFPLGLSLLPFVALPMIDVFWASRLPVGSISFLGYSTRIVIALGSVVVQGMSVVLFPDFSEDARHGRLSELGRKTRAALAAIFALIVPLAIMVFLLQTPLLTVLLQRGKFTVASSQGVIRVLPLYLFGAIWMSLMNIVSRSYFALRDYTTPAFTGLLALAFYVVLCGPLIHSYSYVGIGLAYGVFWAILFVMQTWLLARQLGPILNAQLMTVFSRVLVCAATSLGAVTLCLHLFAYSSSGLLTAAGAATVFLLLYLSLGIWLLPIPQYTEIARALSKRLLPPTATLPETSH